jgi:arylsulfatase A-like enzyme
MLVLSIFVAVLSLKAAVDKPNFIVILTDDQGWGTTSVMIDPLVPDSKSDFFKTPNIERLAASGMRFAQAYASQCNCSPSRAALQTGRSPAALHLTDIIERNSGPDYVGDKMIPPHHVSALPADEQTIPELLKAHDPNYRAAHFGKWHLAGGGPANFGYDESDGPTGNREGSVKANLPDDPKKIFSTTRKSIAFMQEQVKSGHPFYLQVSYYATHSANQSRPDTRDEFQKAPKGKRHDNVPYGAMLADLDTGIGQLLGAVKAAGISSNTYIIYTADNGCIPTEDPGNINGPVRGYKATVWEGGIRVPFMVTGPGVKPDSVSRTPVVGYDILPTICELAGIATCPKVVEGGSFKSVVLGDGSAAVKRPSDFLVFHWPHYQIAKHSTPDTTIIADGWKLHYWWETGQVELFHLDKDLGESKDLAVKEPNRAAALKEMLTNYLATINAQLPVPNPNYNPETDSALIKKKAGRKAGNGRGKAGPPNNDD